MGQFAIRNQLEGPDAPAAQFHRQERPTDVPLNAPPIRSDVRFRSFALAFVGMLCATVIRFVSEIRPLKPDSPDYGYDEALGTETSSVSNANFLSKCSDDSLATTGRPRTAWIASW
jgi:hypothetical protein